jgi:hypothetical protein
MRRAEKRLFAIADRLAAIEREVQLARQELTYHQHLDDDAQRDAAVSESPLDRADARETAADVARFESLLRRLDQERERLLDRRRALLRRLE